MCARQQDKQPAIRESFGLESLESRRLLASASFAVIGDFGDAGLAEANVADLVKGWDPQFVVTVGDNNYPDGEASTIDANIGQYYQQFIGNYAGSYGPGAGSQNRFFPALGNHDWNTTGAQPYLSYLTLPGNERYYDFVQGPVHFFVLDSDEHEPDGNAVDSVQAAWLQQALATSQTPWQIVVLHHPPFSSAQHGSQVALQWPFAEWGADAVLAGHDHVYERIERDGIVYFVNGLGGRQSIYSFNEPVPGSKVRYNNDYGAMRVDASETQLQFEFFNRSGQLIDSHVLNQPEPPPPPPPPKPVITLSAPDRLASEQFSNPGRIVLVREGDLSSDVAVRYTLTGKAINGLDYIHMQSHAWIRAGRTKVNVRFIPIDDSWIEGAEVLKLTISTHSSYIRAEKYITSVTILDNDGPSTKALSLHRAFATPEPVRSFADRSLDEETESDFLMI